MTTKIDRLVVFGDSLSDIGIKRDSPWGTIARGARLMRVNEVWRYSDTRNWTDYLWEWSGGAELITKDSTTSVARSARHTSWSERCMDRHLAYANYAEGGAMGASSHSVMAGFGLGTFAQQVARYEADLRRTPPQGNGLYLVWFGLNDFVTNERPYSNAAPVAQEIVKLCKAVQRHDPNAHFVIGNLPDPLDARRFKKKRLEERSIFENDLTKAATKFNAALLDEVGDGAWGGEVVDIFGPMRHVSRNVGAYNLIDDAQPTEIEVCYDDKAPKNAKAARMVATSDEAHPTQALYRLLAQVWGQKILTKYDVGLLRASREAVWQRLGNNG